MGVLYSEYEDYKEAGDCFRKTTELYKKNLGDQHIDYALSLANLAAIHKKMGDYITAEKLNLQAIAVKKKAVGEHDKTYLTNLANLSNIYMNMGQFKKADSLYRLVLNTQRNVFGEKNMGYISTAMNLGWLHIYRGNYAIADSFLLSTLNQIKTITGTKNSDYALNLGLLGKLNARKLDFSLAESYYLESIDVYNELYGKETTSAASMKGELAMLYVRMGREKEAFDIMTEVMKSKTKQISDNFEWLNDNQKETYWKEEKDFYDHLSWLANQSFQKVPEVASLNYNSALITKSKLLEAKISSENYHREVDEIREELVQRRRLITKMESEGSEEKKKLETLRSEADSLDKRLAMGWPEYAEQKKNLSITWQQVKQQLELNEAAIEFVRFKNEDDSLYYYNALVLRKDAPQPQLVKLCKEKDLKNISPKMGFSAFYPLIWDPMENALKGISTIYYAPTGLLYNVPFPALYALKGKGDQIVPEKTDKHGMIMESAKVTTEENASFLLDRYTLHQLTSTRYLAMGLKQKAKNPISKDMAMLGGVHYDYLPGSNPVELKKGKKDKNATRSSESASGKLAYLEGTKVEIDQIQNTAVQNAWTTTVLSGNEAKEENIVQLEGKEAKCILHLATHGYSFPEYDFNDTTIRKNSLRYSYRYSQNPMVRSGLILAGGNWAWLGSDTLTKLGAEQNGILTASEVAQLNLKKTKLVVLSACETGLGTIDGSEGTFGLKRGFKLAGVEQMIVSLWPVTDKETMELMTLFYTDLTKTLNPIASFEKAQKEMRNKYPQEPEKWAGFVLVR